MSASRPAALTLRQHLDLSTVPELAEFLRFWGPHAKRSNGRADLVGQLQRLMSDENVVYGKVDLLSEKVRQVLLGLLRKTHYSCDLSGLVRGVEGLELEHYEAEAALTALSRRGFVRVTRGEERMQQGRTRYAIPIEMALVMRGLAGVDNRPLESVFVHAGFEPGSVETAGGEPVSELPASVTDAIESLPNRTLRRIAREVIERFGGLVTRREFAQVFDRPRIRWRSAQFLREFGRRGLGTVGHLDLRSKGLGVDDDALLFFSEVVERYVDEWRARPPEHDRVLSAHGDLMSDVRNVLDQIGLSPVRVSKQGSVYKAARARIAEGLQFSPQPLLARRDVADRALAVVRGLGLAVPDEQRQLVATAASASWLDRPLLDQIRDAYGLILDDGAPTLRARHLRGVQRILVELLRQDRGWWPGSSLAMVARNRYLLDLARAERPPSRVRLTVLPHALTELGAAAHDLLVKDLHALGLVDVALSGAEAAGVRISRLGRRFFDARAPEGAAAKPLVVNPDFEILVLPEGDVDDLLHRLDRFAERTRTGEVVHYKLDKGRVERAAVEGDAPEAVLSLLEDHSRSPLPQNVVYSIRSWAENVRSATLARGLLFQTNDPAVVESILGQPALRRFVATVVDATTLLFDPAVSESQIAQELRSLGVYLR